MKKFINKNKFIVLFIAILIFSSIVCFRVYSIKENNQLAELTIEQKLEDFRYMYDILKDNYVYFDVNKRLTGYDWLAHKDEFEKYIKNDNDKDDVYFYEIMYSIINNLNDKHTDVLDPDFFYGCKEVYNKYNSDKYNYTQWVKVLNNPKSEVFYKKLKENFAENDSKNKSNNMKNKTKYKNFNTEILEKDKIAYLKIKSFGDEYSVKDGPEIYKFFINIKDYPFLIIDIRGNSGGSTLYWGENIVAPLTQKNINVTDYSVLKGGEYSLPFYKDIYGENIKPITYLPVNDNYPEEVKRDFKYCIKCEGIIEPKNPVGFNGKIYLLVNNKVFSAAEAFANFAKASKWATLVGEKTAGDGVGCDPVFMTLPNSGIVIRFCAQMGLNPDGTSNLEMGTKPDIELNLTYLGEKGTVDRTVNIIHEIENPHKTP